MDADGYLAHLRADAARLAAAAGAAGLDAPVPSCPEWTVRDLVEHTGSVYSHKVACIRLGSRPPEGAWDLAPAAGADHLAWFGERLDELVAELVARGPAAPAYTWYPPDQTVGFWYRRMAQETVVHRVDAELAAGARTPVDAAIATDGVDELLATFLGGPWWEEEPEPAATGATFALRAGDDGWLVRLEPTAVPVTRGAGDAAATVSGTPEDLLLWLWGRAAGGVTTTGDVTELRQRLALVTD
jgi:uncharacterized protein (TIGR03083 family)